MSRAMSRCVIFGQRAAVHSRIRAWFGPPSVSHHLFLDVAIELTQAHGGSTRDAHTLVDFSFAHAWLAAARAAYQLGVDLDTVQAWAANNEIEHRDDNGTLLVRCDTVLARAHRHGMERRAMAHSAATATAIATGDQAVDEDQVCEYPDGDGNDTRCQAFARRERKSTTGQKS
ncbi:hypothetical protein [Burkholderia gladioli]|uniref:hypothetical protein n=1 Tax=Burkholderia gladioli TaxID=28095 RepID=UPI000A721A10|nr:hypothetical protein [Burkholderia gladioli]